MSFDTRAARLVLCLAFGLFGHSVAAVDEEIQREAAPRDPGQSVAVPSPAPSPSVGIDRLLKLPTSYRVDDVRKGGATRAEWRARFEAARANLAEKEKKLAQVRAELEATAGGASQWKMAPPGADLSGENPVSFRLTQELRRSREEVEIAERQLSELDIEANLAGVPEDWRI